MTNYEYNEDPAEALAAFERGFKRLTEPLRRQVADRHREAIEGSGRPMRSKRLDSIHSVRFSHEEAKALGKTAERMGLRGLSELLRLAARRAVQPVGFRCRHLTVTCGPGFTSFDCGGGCDMEPIYGGVAS